MIVRKTLKIIDDGSTVDDVKKPIEQDGLLITIVASTTVVIFYALRVAGLGQHNVLITSTSLACFLSLPIRKM